MFIELSYKTFIKPLSHIIEASPAHFAEGSPARPGVVPPPSGAAERVRGGAGGGGVSLGVICLFLLGVHFILWLRLVEFWS